MKKITLKIVNQLVVSLLFLKYLLATNIFVSNDFDNANCVVGTAQCQTIQAALNIAENSDSVLVYPGTYEGQGNFNLCQAKNCSHNVTLAGFYEDPSLVVLNFINSAVENSSARAIYMTHNQISTLKSLTIQNFNGTIAYETPTQTAIQIGGGAALFIQFSSALLENVVFKNNNGIIGGAINMLSSNLTLNNCSFLQNQAEISGGAISSYLSNIRIDRSEFIGNNVTSFEVVETASIGGGIYFLGGKNDKFAVKNSVFYNNKAERGGGAIYMESNSKTGSDLGTFFSGNVQYIGNYANGIGTCISTASCNTRGGALYLSVPSVFLKNNTFQDNFVSTLSANSEAQGGAVYSTNLYNLIQQSQGTTIQNCHFLHNSAVGIGGALYVLNQRLSVDNCTFSSNSVETVSPLFTDAPSQGGAIWYSAGSLASQISNSLFTNNVALSGWGGAIFGTESTGLLTLSHCTFLNNAVYSSYTNPAQGGAIMIASGFSMTTQHCVFKNNTALPHLNLTPLTYSGSGGALFVQSSNISVSDCEFETNFALTGQFDAGSAGGAIVLEDSYPVQVTHSKFKSNGAAGYYGYSSFASPGTGGAIYIKFSSAAVSDCHFHNNWVSAGGSEKSIGGAVAIYFDYSSVSTESKAGVSIKHSTFNNNTAYGQLCLLNGQSGYNIGDILAQNQGKKLPVAYHLNFTQQSVFTLDSATLLVLDRIILDSPIQNPADNNIANHETYGSDPSLDLANIKFSLKNNALLNISTHGIMVILSDTYIESSNSTSNAVYNTGEIALLGDTQSIVNQISIADGNGKITKDAAKGSLTSTLTVYGNFIQTMTGTISLILNTTYSTAPVVSLSSNKSIAGSVNISFYINTDNNKYPSLLLYETETPSSWPIISYTILETGDDESYKYIGNNRVKIEAPQGLIFTGTTKNLVTDEVTDFSVPISNGVSNSYVANSAVAPTIVFDRIDTISESAESAYKGKSLHNSNSNSNNNNNNNINSNRALAETYGTNTPKFVQTLQISNIGCNHIDTYYYGVPSAIASGNLYPCYACLLNSSCNLCNDGSCMVGGTCANGARFTSSCCTSSCNPPYGSCEANSDNTDFSCHCNSIFYMGDNCDELSSTSIGLISGGASLLMIILICFLAQRRQKRQKKIVLDELRDGLLRNTEGSNNEYIQYMQQALILNDVFVKFEEIKLEEKVGEGSFGVVHKATFRGAQVAVKQMRSMFLELTEKEIEEFRKEAYVMSRLRHPNIVLVMGISLVDQEPIPLPKTRSVTQQAMNDSMAESGHDAPAAPKKKPQKTVCIITEFLEQGSLADILYGPTRLPAEVWTYELVLTCALQAARGMLYLHSHSPPICHRDLKSSNLVVDDHWVVKVTDFGMSRIVPQQIQDEEKGIGEREEDRGYTGRDSVCSTTEEHNRNSQLMTNYHSSRHSIDSLVTGGNTVNTAGTRFSTFSPEMTSNLGTTAWCAPELLTSASKTNYSVKVDVYSYGMVLWELWEKKRPFDEFNSRFDIMDAIRAGKRPEISSNCPPTYRSLMQRCWQTNPARRPNFTYIVRYLKDELASVKRKRGATGGGMAAGMIGYRGDIFMSTSAPSYTPDQLTRDAHEDRGSTSYQEFVDGPDRPSFLRRSFQAASNLVSGSPRESNAFNWNSKGRSTESGNGDGKGSGGHNSGVASSVGGEAVANRNSNTKALMLTAMNNNNNATPNKTTGNSDMPMPLPEGRTPLVAAFDRSLSYLAESPNPSTSPTAAQLYGNNNPMHNQRHTISAANSGPYNNNNNSNNNNNFNNNNNIINNNNNSNNISNSNNNRESMSTPGRPPAAQQSGVKMNNNNWRNNYVMKHSGWNKDKPDTGLPPSLSVSNQSPMMTSTMSQASPARRNAPVNINTTSTTNTSDNATNVGGIANTRTADRNKPSDNVAPTHKTTTNHPAADKLSILTPVLSGNDSSVPAEHMDSPLNSQLNTSTDEQFMFDIDEVTEDTNKTSPDQKNSPEGK